MYIHFEIDKIRFLACIRRVLLIFKTILTIFSTSKFMIIAVVERAISRIGILQPTVVQFDEEARRGGERRVCESLGGMRFMHKSLRARSRRERERERKKCASARWGEI